MDHRRAVVVGGSMAGMLAARALADHLPVTLVERDELPRAPRARSGLPQGPHLHTVLARGMTLLERMLPGLRREIVDGGAIPIDWGTELGWLGPFGWAAPFRRGELETVYATRDLLDSCVRAHLRRDRRIEWIERAPVDATGRASRLPAWLRVAGFDGPAETSIDSRTVVASALARLARPLPNGWK